MEQVKDKKAVETEDGGKTKKFSTALLLNIITGVVLVLAVMFLIEGLYTNKHMHNNYFGYAVLPVASESMNIGKDSIKKGDVIFVKLLNDKDKEKLNKGDIVTFKHFINELDAEALVTHRILDIQNGQYVTRGDANIEQNVEYIKFEKVVGVYKGKIGKIGHLGLFFETKAGSFIMIVVPFLLLLLLSVFQFIRSLRVYNKEKIEIVTEEARTSVLSEEKERMRLEILAELEKEKKSGGKE